jgi:hypothetical protein
MRPTPYQSAGRQNLAEHVGLTVPDRGADDGIEPVEGVDDADQRDWRLAIEFDILDVRRLRVVLSSGANLVAPDKGPAS